MISMFFFIVWWCAFLNLILLLVSYLSLKCAPLFFEPKKKTNCFSVGVAKAARKRTLRKSQSVQFLRRLYTSGFLSWGARSVKWWLESGTFAHNLKFEIGEAHTPTGTNFVASTTTPSLPALGTLTLILPQHMDRSSDCECRFNGRNGCLQ